MFSNYKTHICNSKLIFYTPNCNIELINKRTKLGHTPLWIASYKGHVDIVRFLVEQAGANITISSSSGSTPFVISCQQGSIEVLKYLRSIDKNLSDSTSIGAKCLFMACFNGHLDIVEDILEKFPNLINNINEFGKSPLWLASHNGSLLIVKFLIEHGANISNVRERDADMNTQNGNTIDAENEMHFVSRTSIESPLIPSCTGMVLKFIHRLSCDRIYKAVGVSRDRVLLKKRFTKVLHFEFKGDSSTL